MSQSSPIEPPIKNKDDPLQWSDEELKILRHEALIAEVLKRRAPADAATQTPTRWQRFASFLGSSGGAVLIGGLLGSLITGIFQYGMKEREFQQAFVKARGDQALVSYKEYLEQERAIVDHAYELIGKCISAADDLIDLTSPHFDPEKYPGIEDQRLSIRKEYNNRSKQWREEREKLRLLISYYHQGDPGVINTWDNVQQATTGYMFCAQKRYLEYTNKAPTETEGVCKTEKDGLLNELGQLNASIIKTRRYPWEGWESPESLRAELKD